MLQLQSHWVTGTQGFVKGYKWQKYTLKEDKSATCNKVIPSFVSLHSEAETQHVVCDSPCLTLLLRILREYDVLFFFSDQPFPALSYFHRKILSSFSSPWSLPVFPASWESCFGRFFLSWIFKLYLAQQEQSVGRSRLSRSLYLLGKHSILDWMDVDGCPYAFILTKKKKSSSYFNIEKLDIH